MEITCPSTGMYAAVSMLNTICVRGTVSGTAEEPGAPTALPTTIRVRVVSGHIVPPPPTAEPVQTGDVDVMPLGTDWSASVPVPGSSPTGEPLTVVAWEKVGSGSWGPPLSEQFYGGGPNPTDCCAGSP